MKKGDYIQLTYRHITGEEQEEKIGKSDRINYWHSIAGRTGQISSVHSSKKRYLVNFDNGNILWVHYDWIFPIEKNSVSRLQREREDRLEHKRQLKAVKDLEQKVLSEKLTGG